MLNVNRRGCSLAWPILVVLLAPVAHAASPFTFDVVDPSTPVAACPCIALDSLGNPHISYHSVTDRNLIYGAWDGTAWTIEPVDTSGDEGYCSALALDSAGDPHVAYWDRTLLRLRYAWKSAGFWHYETVDSGWGGIDIALRLDDQGRPHVVYSAALQFWYAVRGPAGWTKTLVDPLVQGYYSDLALDPSGLVHIVYADEIQGDLHYAVKNGPQWTYELVDSADVVGQGCSLARDATGALHVAYFDWTNSRVRYATRGGGGWVVDSTGLAGSDPRVAIDPSGAPHIAFYQIDGHLGYASRNVGEWNSEVVDPSNFNGMGASLAFDRDGNPFIAYEHQSDPRLHLADTALHLLVPAGGERWSAGSTQTIRWRGAGVVGIQLSPDGGASYPLQYSGTSDTSRAIVLPLWSTTIARCRIQRADPASVAESRGTFTIAFDSTSSAPSPELGIRFLNPHIGSAAGTFILSLPLGATVTIELYDVQGKVVARRPSQRFVVGGVYPVVWDPGPIPSGTYFIRASVSSGRTLHAKWTRLR